MEYFDIVDMSGNPTGKTVDRNTAHIEGIMHRTSHVWLLREHDGAVQILLQKRCMAKDSFPGCYDISSAGHIPAGSDFIPSAIRELKEELGLTVSGDDLHYCGDRIIYWDDEFRGVPFHDRQFSRVFVLWEDRDEEEFILQKEEVESVLWMDYDDCVTAVNANTIRHCIVPEELQMLRNAVNAGKDSVCHNTVFIQRFMEYYSYPADAVGLFTEVLDKLDRDRECARIFDALHNRFTSHQASFCDAFISELNHLAEKLECPEYTLHFVFLLTLTEELNQTYALMGIPDKVYYDTMDDMRCKLLECMECKGVPGTFVLEWYDGFFRLERAAYGRFQYELRKYRGEDIVLPGGREVRRGDTVINFHIPSSGVSMTDDVRLHSYKEAYKRLRGVFPDGMAVFMCHSWLLYPDLKEFLPEGMNILKFQNDFTYVKRNETEEFEDIWRIFGKDSGLPYDKLPRDTRLKAAYADWLSSGRKGGDGLGLFAFDGERIVR